MNTEQKIDEILKKVSRIEITMQVEVVHREQHRKELNGHETDIEKLKAYHNKTMGVVGFVGLFMGAIATWLVTHLTK